MTLREQLLIVADCFAEASGIGRKRVSTLVLNGGGKLDAIAQGRDLTTGSFERAMQWFSQHWPADLEWPADIDRPRSSPVVDPDGPAPSASRPSGEAGGAFCNGVAG